MNKSSTNPILAEFIADKVQISTGKKVDNSGQVTFVVGEYMLEKIKDLAVVVDTNLKVTVEKYEGQGR